MERSLSAILPVRNVETMLRRTVLGMLDILPELTRHFDLILVDDCSTDATIEVADELAALYPQLMAVRHAVPQGRVAAIQTGLGCGQGEVVFFTEEDCRLALDQVRRLWRDLDEYEIVLGRPWDPMAGATGMSSASRTGGGYQVGFRRVFRRVADALADQESLTAKLLRYGIPWRELRLRDTASHRRPDAKTASRAADSRRDAELDVRSVRTDRPESEAGKTPQPNYRVRFRHAIADE